MTVTDAQNRVLASHDAAQVCPHPSIVIYRGEGVPPIFACEDCRLRFYPACRECVDVGHRNGHPEASA